MISLLACAANPSDATTGSSGEASTAAETGTPTTGDSEPTGGESSTGAPPEQGLRLHQLQAMGTHNSYHVSSGDSVKDLDYTHKPLSEQLDAGARQFELDINFKQEPGQAIGVYHLELLDQMSNCPLLKDCLQGLRGWSQAHPGHHFLYVMIEVKTAFNAIYWDEFLADLEAEILAVWPREDIVAPDDVAFDARGNLYATEVMDGTAQTLLSQLNEELAGTGVSPWPVSVLAIAGHDPSSVPARDERILLPGRRNLSAVGEIESFSDSAPQVLANLASKAAAALGLRIGAVDLFDLSPRGDLTQPVIIEVNGNPGLKTLELAGRSDLIRKIWVAMLSELLEA